MSVARNLLLLGLGNPLFGDDGLGIAALEQLRLGWVWPEGVRLVDGGTLGLGLLPELEAADAAILLDAVAADAAPGTILRLDGPEVSHRLPQRLSPHEIGVADLLFGARLLGHCPEPLVLLGIVPERLDYGLERSSPVEGALAALVLAAVAEARRLGFEAHRRNRHESHSPDPLGSALDGVDGL